MSVTTALACRHCASPLEVSVVDLGDTPLANSYVPAGAPPEADPAFELHARLCTTCGLVQVRDAVDPAAIFSDYAYFSSYSSSWLAHAKAFAEMSIERFGIGAGDLVIEVASNDGYLLKNYVQADIEVLGIEPAANVAEVAIDKGVATRVAFFGRDLAKELVAEGKRPKLIAGNNVFAHVPDINSFAKGLAILAGQEGVVALEFPHLGQLIEHTQFDTIYHEHFSYLSLAAAERVLGRAGLAVFDIEQLTTHGGSLRVFSAAPGSRDETGAVQALRDAETAAGLDELATYAAFGERVGTIKRDFLEFLAAAKSQGKLVAAYGAAAKGNTLLNYCGVGREDIGFVADLSPHKQGLCLPGSRIPIISPEELKERRPDYVVILPWNLRAEIMQQLDAVRSWSGRFVTAVPELTVGP